MRFSAKESPMRILLSMLIALGTAGFGTREVLAQTDQPPVFRSGVEVMEVDVTVVDAKGMPLRDLRAPDFTVTVDGQPRRVISAEFISDNAAAGKIPARPSRSARIEQHRSASGASDHDCGRSQQHRYHRAAQRDGGAQAVRQRSFLPTIVCRSSPFHLQVRTWSSRPTTR